MAQRKLLTSGSAFNRTDDRWGSVMWYMDKKPCHMAGLAISPGD